MEKSSSKIISGGDTGEVKQWRPPSVGGSSAGGQRFERPSGTMLTAEQLEALQKQAYDEGYEQGRQKGFKYGHKEALAEGRERINTLVNQVEALMETLQFPMKQLDDQVEHELVELINSMVRQLVRREMRNDPGQIIGVVREALAILPVGSRSVTVLLHPDDAALVREIYDMSDREQGWRIVDDPVMARGGCKVVTETSQVDASLESRLTALIAPLLGSERSNEES